MYSNGDADADARCGYPLNPPMQLNGPVVGLKAAMQLFQNF